MKDWKLSIACDSMSLPCMYEMLAEEAVEVAHAALKRARVLRGENPTPASDTSTCLTEELSDLALVTMCIPESPNEEIMSGKLDRWVSRIGYGR